MYQQSVMTGWNQAQWNAPGAGSTAVPWSGAVSTGNSMVSQYDSQGQQHDHIQYYHQQPTLQLQQQQQQQQQLSSSSSSSNVTLYTQYYHSWKAVADSLSSTQEQKQWATYYADLSSRAAHYYYQNPNTTQPPPQDLPPAPPGATETPTPVVEKQQQATTSGSTNPKPVDERSFQVYVDKCLQNCKSLREKEVMVQKTKTVLQKAIIDGNLHTKDWSREPLLSSALYRQPSPPLQASSPSGNYYGPTSSITSSAGGPTIKPFVIKNSKNNGCSKKKEKAPMAKKRSYPESFAAQDSYYGPSASILSVSPTGSQKRTKKLIQGTSGFSVSNDALNKRAQRFSSSLQQSASFDTEETTQEGPVIVGTCQVLEKEYLRLTSAPKPELVRPQPILEKHFGNLKNEYENVNNRRDYLWFCSQLKAMRQDCTVQHLKNEFCVHVYEFHAKVALEQNDFNEFNQCQTQLKYLYPSLKDTVSFPNRAEFISYRILYAVYLNLHSKKATIDMKEILAHEEKTNDACVTHALAVLSAAQEGNYHAFFSRLYPSQHGHQNYFLEKIASILRKRALESMCAAYRPTLEADFVCEALKISDGVVWLEQVGCELESVSTESGKESIVIKTKETVLKEPDSVVTTSKLM